MPYFQRKPIEGLVDTVRSIVPIPGLPSRGPAPATRATAGTRPVSPPAAITGIVEQAVAVLASERPSISRRPTARSDIGSVASTQSTRVSQLQEQVNALIEQLAALVAGPPGLDIAAPQSTIFAGQEPPSDAGGSIVEPAPVLAPPGPVAPGGSARISISLVNEDEQPAQIVFVSTGLVGEDGERIPAERVSFQPRELTLQPGNTGEVIVGIVVPAQTRCGVYSGLVRASKLDYLHGVLVVQVEYP
jgi:hypothetical protein